MSCLKMPRKIQEKIVILLPVPGFAKKCWIMTGLSIKYSQPKVNLKWATW